MSLCSDCFKGKWEDLGGVPTYVTVPQGDYPKDKVILYLADAFGPKLVDAQLLADAVARNGWKTVIPDILNGDGVPLDALDAGAPPYDFAPWLLRHGPEQTRPPLDKVLAALKEDGIKTIGATGYCFGARYVFDLALEDLISVAVVSHPSLLKVPEDLEDPKRPFSSTAAHSIKHSLTKLSNADEILGNGKFAPGYKREYFEGCTHGFAVKGDLSDPKVKAGKEGAFAAAVAWFEKYL